MKTYVFFLLLFLTTYTVSAQYNQFSIVNNTSCTTYVVLYGTTSTSTPLCQANYRSSVIAVAPGATVNYANPSTVPSGMTNGSGGVLTSLDVFTGVRVYHGPTFIACITHGNVMMSDCLASGVTSTAGFDLEDYTTNCFLCSSANINWFVASATSAGILIN